MDKIKCGWIECILIDKNTGKVEILSATLKLGYTQLDLTIFNYLEKTIIELFNNEDSEPYIDSNNHSGYFGILWNKDNLNYQILKENEMGNLHWHEYNYPEIPDFLK